MARMSYLHPVQRIKHVVDAQTSIPVNTAIPQVLAKADDAPVLANKSEVLTGSVVRSLFITVEGVTTESSGGKTPNFYLIFYKNPGGNLTMPNGNAVGVSDNKRFVFHQEMVMLQGDASTNGVPRNVFKGVLKIPKTYQRMGPKDEISLQYFIPSTGVAITVCHQAHYKELR